MGGIWEANKPITTRKTKGSNFVFYCYLSFSLFFFFLSRCSHSMAVSRGIGGTSSLLYLNPCLVASRLSIASYSWATPTARRCSSRILSSSAVCVGV